MPLDSESDPDKSANTQRRGCDLKLKPPRARLCARGLVRLQLFWMERDRNQASKGRIAPDPCPSSLIDRANMHFTKSP